MHKTFQEALRHLQVSMYNWVNSCVLNCMWEQSQRIVPTRLTASNTFGKIYGTTVSVCTEQKSHEAKGGNQKAFYSTLLELNTARLKTDRMTKQNLKEQGKQVIQLQQLKSMTKVKIKSWHDWLCYGGNVAIKNTRGLWLWLKHYQWDILDGEKLSRPQLGLNLVENYDTVPNNNWSESF